MVCLQLNANESPNPRFASVEACRYPQNMRQLSAAEAAVGAVRPQIAGAVSGLNWGTKPRYDWTARAAPARTMLGYRALSHFHENQNSASYTATTKRKLYTDTAQSVVADGEAEGNITQAKPPEQRLTPSAKRAHGKFHRFDAEIMASSSRCVIYPGKRCSCTASVIMA